MMTVCPKCQYHRITADTAPDWQCPKCGVAYNKVASSIREPKVADYEEVDQVVDGGISPKKIAFAFLFVLLVGFGFWKSRQEPQFNSAAPISDRFDAAKKAYDMLNFQKATKEFTDLAMAGDSKAQYYLGRIYASDWSSPSASQRSDREKSVYWYKKAAEQGEMLAQIELGDIYKRNLGGGANPHEETFKWYQMAADQGDANSQYFIGSFYEHGWGIEKDISQAIAWYRAAADQGHGGSLLGLGMLYTQGIGVSENQLTAYKFMLLAAAQNDRDPSLEGAFWARKKSQELAKQLSSSELSEADEFVATWKPGQLLPE